MCWARQTTRDVRQPALPSSQGRCTCEWVQRPLGLCCKAAEPDATRAASWRTQGRRRAGRSPPSTKLTRGCSEIAVSVGRGAGPGRGGEDRVSSTGLLDRAQLKRSVAG